MFNDLDNLFKLDKSNIYTAGKVAAKAYFEVDDFTIPSKEPSKQLRFITKLMNLTLQISVKFGSVYAPSKNIEGIAAWLSYDKINLSIWQYIRYGALSAFFSAGKEGRKNLLRYPSIASKKHEQHANFPHMYLYNLAIDPVYQGQGYASRLLKPMLAKLDENNLPCYLETAKRNLALYEHFGFEVVEHVTQPEIDMDMWLMLRK